MRIIATQALAEAEYGIPSTWDGADRAEIGVVCPSRENPAECARMVQSVFRTATSARVFIYTEDDQLRDYCAAIEASGADFRVDRMDRARLVTDRGLAGARVVIHVGGQIGPIASTNHLIHYYRDPIRIYGAVPDDAYFSTHGWDRYLRSALESFPGRIGLIAARHNCGDYVNFPWASREWIDAVGWYFYPQNFHHCADTVLELLGDALGMKYASPGEFEMHHDQSRATNRGRLVDDARQFLVWCVTERRRVIQQVREAIERAGVAA